MIPMKASAIAEIVGGALHGDDVNVTSHAFLKSSECLEGSIFLAIKGENVDGHDFVEDAFAHGAVLALTTKEVGNRCIVVDDVTEAIGRLAARLRSQLTQMKVIGITGSQGKTTAKEYLRAILERSAETVATEGNHNNELGVPLTLLKCTQETRYCVVEIGARHQGDIAALAAIARPDIAIVLRVAAAHIGEFGSIEAIAETKAELIHSLDESGIAIVGNYDSYTSAMSTIHQGEVLTFGEDSSSLIRATDIELREGCPYFELVTPEGRATVALGQYGLHQIPNALAAASAAHALGLTAEQIAGSLSTAHVEAKWRMEVRELGDLTLINDSYNASPDSMTGAITTLVHLTQERGGESWAFVGKMLELGDSSPRAHADIAALASQLGVDHLVAINASEYQAGVPQGSSMVLHTCADREEALDIASHINRGDVVLCKASRSERLELVAEGIEEMWREKIKNENRERGE